MEAKENKFDLKDADVHVIFVNPFRVKKELDCEALIKAYPKFENFINNDFDFNHNTYELLGNCSKIFTNGKVLCLCWTTSKEDKALCMIKLDFFFRKDYRFFDLISEKEIQRVNI